MHGLPNLKCCILLVSLFESYDDARTWEHQTSSTRLYFFYDFAILVPIPKVIDLNLYRDFG